jgi:uncharacterized membrane protein
VTARACSRASKKGDKMAKFFGNLNLVLLVGVLIAIAVMTGFDGKGIPFDANSVFRWFHVFFGILWIGLLYYLNFVQVPTMPSIPAEQTGAINKHIAPNVLFYFRYAALLTVLTGLVVAHLSGYLFSPNSDLQKAVDKDVITSAAVEEIIAYGKDRK